MTLPGLLLAAAEAHRCFSGVYSGGHQIPTVIDPAGGLQTIVDVQCMDCLTFRLGVDAALLTPNTSAGQIALELTAHMQAHRAFDLSVAGYHTQGSGFWLSATYWAPVGLFFLGNTRGAGTPTPPLDVLLRAFGTGLLTPTHPAMTDPKEYQCQDVYLSVVPPPPVMPIAALLASPFVAQSWKPGFTAVTLAEFLPIASIVSSSPTLAPLAVPPAVTTPAPSPTQATQATQAGSASSSTPGASSPRSSSVAPPVRKAILGEQCEACGDIVSERQLFSSTYIGCRCG